MLNLLGISVGTAAIVAILYSGQLATQHALAQFNQLGTDLYAVNIENVAAQQKSLDAQQITHIANISPNILAAAPYTLNYANIISGDKVIASSLLGATQTLQHIAKINIATGRFISTLDQQQYFCILGNDIVKFLQHQGLTNLIGKQIQVGEHYFTIVGTAAPWPESIFLNVNINRAIIIPIDASFTLNNQITIQNILFKLKPHANITTLPQEIEPQIQRLLPDVKLFSRNAKQILASLESQRKTFILMLGAIGTISLVVGGIGVMNITLASVMERRREIGVRRAIGARPLDIQLMFLIEAITLTVSGGICGVIIGMLITFILTLANQWVFYWYWAPIIIGSTASLLTGLFFGYYPAAQAARLDPIQTLRSE